MIVEELNGTFSSATSGNVICQFAIERADHIWITRGLLDRDMSIFFLSILQFFFWSNLSILQLKSTICIVGLTNFFFF